MAHGTPDWGVTAGGATVYQLTDMAELAVRLGSIVSFDRRGTVLFLDSFEDGLNRWETFLAGTGASVTLSRAWARNGAYSALLTAGSSGAANALIRRRDSLRSLTALGLEGSFRRPNVVSSLQFRLGVLDGSYQSTYAVRWVESSGNLDYMNDTGGWTTFATGVTLYGFDTLSYTLKLVIKADVREYVEVMLGPTTYSLAGISPVAAVDASAPYIVTDVRLYGRTGFNDQLYVDDVILTQAEPV
jgi:hypothetical protein